MTITTKPDSVSLLQNIKDYTVNVGTVVSGQTLNVKMVTDGTTIYDEDLTPDSAGNVSICDITSLLELFSREKVDRLVTVTFTYGTDTETHSFDVVYCMVATTETASTFFSKHFNNLVTSKRMCEGRKELLSWWGTSEETATVRAYFTDNSYTDTTLTVTSKTYASMTLYTIDVSPSLFASSTKTMYRYVVTVGDRTMEYVMDYELEDGDPVLLFVNDFGVTEWFHAHGTKLSQPEYERSGTTILGVYKNYKVKETRYWTADTGILDENEEETFYSLLRSYEVYVCYKNLGSTAWNTGKEITITENDIESSNDDDALNRFTFKYRIAGRNGNSIKIVQHPVIHTETYTKVYE